MTPLFHPAARDELAAAMRTGERHAPGLGAELVDEIERVTALLCLNPRIGSNAVGDCLRVPLKRFPFAIIYRASEETIRILAIAHTRRRPGYWIRRI